MLSRISWALAQISCFYYITNLNMIRYDRWFPLENWQASCQFNLAHVSLKRLFSVNTFTYCTKVSAISWMLAVPMLAAPLYFRTLSCYRNCIIIIYYYVLPLLRVSELLHAHQTVKTHTDVQNRDLVNTFSTFFVCPMHMHMHWTDYNIT